MPSPVKEPQNVDMVIFRENTEDIYAGIEFQEGTDDARKLTQLLKDNFPDKFKNPAQLKGFYNLMANPKITHAQVLASHFAPILESVTILSVNNAQNPLKNTPFG